MREPLRAPDPRGGPRRAEAIALRASWPPALLAAAFFLSGASALVYELVWFRLLGYIFGSTATAAATLLSAYLFGLGLGAWVFGVLSDRLARLPLVYIAVEVGIGLYGLGSHALLHGGTALYALTHAWTADSPRLLLLARFTVSFVLIAIPTTLMGGTFPFMVHLLRGSGVDVGRATGRAYAINTAGAALGALALPTLLLPSLGMRLTLAVAAAGNLAAAGCVLLRVRRLAPETLVSTDDALAPTASAVLPPAAPILVGFLLSSFASLALETVWARHLAMFFGPQIFTFAFVLFAYLLGLFLGGACYARFHARGMAAATLLRAGLLLAAAGVALPLPFLDRLPLPQIHLMLALGASHRTFLLTSGLETVALILVPALGFGLVFPAVVDILSHESRGTGRSVGLAYVVNTVGTTLGSITAGFLLLPGVGTQRTLELAVVLIAAALALAWVGRWASSTPVALRIAVPAALLAVLVLPRWDWRLAHAMYGKDPLLFLQRYTTGQLEPMLAGLHLAYFAEGTQATVSVVEYGTTGLRALFVNGKPDASNFPDDMVTQRLLAYVPAMFHPAPQRALVIGVGSGTTVGSLEQFPLESIDGAEISPEVAEAARLHFADINGDYLADPRLRLHLDDGRSFMHFQPPASYDIIISEPSNPWMAGVSTLFTDEFFAEVRTKLRPGGIFCQWFHYYSISLDHIRLVMRTFSRNFPESAVFALHGQNPVGDILLIGANGPLRLVRLPEDPSLPDAVRAGLAKSQNPGAQQLLNGLVAAPGDAARFAGEGPLNTDDHLILEFEAPADRFAPSPFFDNLRAMMTATERTFLAVGPTAAESPAAVEVGRDGFSLPRGLPAGAESRRGATILTRPVPGRDEISRWILLGREFAQTGETTGLYRMAGMPQGLAEMHTAVAALAGPAAPAAEGNALVNGHPATWVATETGEDRTVALGWICPERGRAFLLAHRTRRDGAPAAAEAAADLAERFPCAHGSH